MLFVSLQICRFCQEQLFVCCQRLIRPFYALTSDFQLLFIARLRVKLLKRTWNLVWRYLLSHPDRHIYSWYIEPHSHNSKLHICTSYRMHLHRTAPIYVEITHLHIEPNTYTTKLHIYTSNQIHSKLHIYQGCHGQGKLREKKSRS